MATNIFQGFGTNTANAQPVQTQQTNAFASAWPTFTSFTPSAQTSHTNTSQSSQMVTQPTFSPTTFTPQTFNPPAFGTPTQNSSQTTNQNNQEKGQIIQCLTESKNVQMAILAELKAMNQKMTTPQPAPVMPQVTAPQSAPAIQQVQGFGFNKAVHTGVFCNSCTKNNIVGVRYKCIICADYDICDECEGRLFPVHDATHAFIKIKDPQQHTLLMEKKPMVFPVAT